MRTLKNIYVHSVFLCYTKIDAIIIIQRFNALLYLFVCLLVFLFAICSLLSKETAQFLISPIGSREIFNDLVCESFRVGVNWWES